MKNTCLLTAVVVALATCTTADEQKYDLSSINHIVFFMQENRAFNHYYGTMAGVRGFKDPNVKYNDRNVSMFYQPTGREDSEYLLPFYLGDDPAYEESNQCVIGGSNDWAENHQTWNHGQNDAWVTNNTALSWGYYKRNDIPYHFEIVDGWTVADMYAESVIGPTCPNRATWVSGTINAECSPVGDYETNGGQFIENWLNKGCEKEKATGKKYACYPLRWKTIADTLEENDIDWFVYQQRGNFGDNPFQWWTQFQNSNESDPMVQKGMSFVGMEGFYKQAKEGTLPPVSWVIGPFEMSEHPPHRPVDGAWLHYQILDSILKGPLYNETAVFVSYDETGGFGDHVLPFVSPEGTKGEWIMDPKNTTGYVPTGPGFRVPFYVISPFTRGGHVFSEPSDHNSQLLFLEEWVQARYNISIKQETMNPWRRGKMSDLVNMFDFENPDFSVPKLTEPPSPRFKNGVCQSSFDCRNKWKSQKNGPPVPYGKQTEKFSLYAENGYKKLRGELTEGRYLVIENNSKNPEGLKRRDTLRGRRDTDAFASDEGTENYDSLDERFILYQGDLIADQTSEDVFSADYYLQSVANGKFIGEDVKPAEKNSDAAQLEINFTPGKGYTIRSNGKYLTFDKSSLQPPQFQSKETFFNIYSVTY